MAIRCGGIGLFGSSREAVARIYTLTTFPEKTMRVSLITTALLLGLTAGASAQQGAAAEHDSMPARVVQRFVDAANARDANAMAALVAIDSRFERFPGGQVIVQSRDSIRAFYARSLGSLPQEFAITVQPRIVEGAMVIDQEHFTGLPGTRTQATWMYLVRNGLIQRAWVLDGNAVP